MEQERRGGVLLRAGDARGLVFVPANVAARVAALSAVTPVPGVRPPAMGIALADGDVVTVLEIAPEVRAVETDPGYRPGSDWPLPGANRAVICEIDGQRVAIVGGTLVATGVFEDAVGLDGIIWRGETVPALDVRALYGLAETAIWASRSRGRGTSLRPPDGGVR